MEYRELEPPETYYGISGRDPVNNLYCGTACMDVESHEIEIKHHALTDLYYFAKNILGYDLLTDRIHKPLCNFIDNAGDVLILMPRDHFKSTCVISFVVWSIVRNPDIKILYSHKILARSKEILYEIKGHFETNATFRHFFGDWTGEPWTANAITVNKRKAARHEPTLTVGATDHDVQGGHYNLVINDDLAGLEDMYSEAARQQTLRYYKSVRYLRDERDCREINIGTRWAPEDISNYIITKRPEVKARIRRARTAAGKPYFRERYTDARLKQLENEDPILYSAQMMNSPISKYLQLYPLDKLLFYDHGNFKQGENYCYVDPAFGRRSRGTPCFLSMPIVSVVDNKVFVVEWITNREKPEFNEHLLIEKIIQYNVKRLGIESNAGQSEFIRNVKRTLDAQNIILGIEEINHTTNKDRRIESMHGTVTSNVFFREDWKNIYPEAMKQLMQYPQGKFVDAPDALEGVVSMARARKRAGHWIEHEADHNSLGAKLSRNFETGLPAPWGGGLSDMKW